MNPFWSRIHWLLWCTIIRVIKDDWFWFRLPQRNAPLARLLRSCYIVGHITLLLTLGTFHRGEALRDDKGRLCRLDTLRRFLMMKTRVKYSVNPVQSLTSGRSKEKSMGIHGWYFTVTSGERAILLRLSGGLGASRPRAHLIARTKVARW